MRFSNASISIVNLKNRKSKNRRGTVSEYSMHHCLFITIVMSRFRPYPITKIMISKSPPRIQNRTKIRRVKSPILFRSKEIVVPSLQNFKTDSKLFFSPKNLKSLQRLFYSKHLKHQLIHSEVGVKARKRSILFLIT
jgi:hypothetical protein